MKTESRFTETLDEIDVIITEGESKKIVFEGYVLCCQGGLNNPEGIIFKRKQPPDNMPYKKYKITLEELPE